MSRKKKLGDSEPCDRQVQMLYPATELQGGTNTRVITKTKARQSEQPLTCDPPDMGAILAELTPKNPQLVSADSSVPERKHGF